MKNIIEYIKDKSYYLLGGIVVVIILLIIINACSKSSGSYDKIEQKMVNCFCAMRFLGWLIDDWAVHRNLSFDGCFFDRYLYKKGYCG